MSFFICKLRKYKCVQKFHRKKDLGVSEGWTNLHVFSWFSWLMISFQPAPNLWQQWQPVLQSRTEQGQHSPLATCLLHLPSTQLIIFFMYLSCLLLFLLYYFCPSLSFFWGGYLLLQCLGFYAWLNDLQLFFFSNINI